MVFDWRAALIRNGRNDGLIFQKLCAALFEAEGFHVRVCAEGGGDFGRDLEISRIANIGFSGRAESWVECKSRISQSAVAIGELRVNFQCAFVEQIPRLVFITNYRLANETRTAIQRFNDMTPRLLKTSTIEKEQLENWIRHHPAIYVRFFAPRTSADSYEAPTGPTPVSVTCALSSEFRGDDPHLIARAKNVSFEEKHLDIEVGGRAYRISLEPLDEARAEIPVSSDDDLKPTFRVGNSQLRIDTDDVPPRLGARIDHLFVDPNNDVATLREAMAAQSSVFVSGSAGMGKSRLLREAARGCAQRPVTIDLSFLDYRYTLAEHLVMSMLEFELPTLEAIGNDIITAVLQRVGCDAETAEIVTQYVRRQPIASNEAIVNAIVAAFEQMRGDRYLFLDNVHQFSVQDLHIFERLLQRRVVRIVCSARGDEIQVPATQSFIDSQMERGSLRLLELEECPIRVRVEKYLDVIASDADCRAFLNRYRNSRSFHELLLTLKELRIARVIEQHADGRISLREQHDRTAAERSQGYAALLKAVVGAYGERSEELLRAAAVYGFTFPHTFITETIGGAATTLIDQLVRAEILFDTGKDVAGIGMIRFDHELTRDLVYADIGTVERLDRHKRVIEFMLRLSPAHDLYVPRELSRHYEQTHDIPRAVLFSNEDARLRVRESRLADAWAAYERSWKLVRRHVDQHKLVAAPLETETLEKLIPTGMQVRGTAAMKPYISSLELNLTYAPDDLRSATVYEFKAQVHGDAYEFDAALNAADHALDIYGRNHAAAAYARVLNIKGVLMKQSNASPIDTLRVHRDALRRFKSVRDPAGIAEAMGDLGAVLLECRLPRAGGRALNTRERSRARKTVFWWRRSTEVLKNASDHVRLCFHQIDFAYINALFEGYSDGAELQLRAALELARRLDLPLYICRALINYANFLALAPSKPRMTEARELNEQALRLARELGDVYLETLSTFSEAVFRRVAGDKARRPDKGLIHLFETECLPALADARVVDWRLTNFARFMAFHFSDARAAVGELDGRQWAPFAQKLTLRQLDSIEADNPFYAGRGLYVTYY